MTTTPTTRKPVHHRRWTLGLGGALAACAALYFAVGSGGKPPKKWYQLGAMSDEILDQVVLFYLGEAWAGMTDIGEVLETARRVDAKDPRSWTREWRKTAERLERAAGEAERAGHDLSAGELWLRTASYWRAALHRHMDPGTPEVSEIARREMKAFGSAMRLLALPVESVEIPYEGAALNAWYYRASGAGRALPTIVIHQGRDAWAEDNFYLGREALRRGYNCLIVDGPGQGTTLRLRGIPFRPDWERVIGPVVDWLERRPEVAKDRIGLIGMSMGGYLAPRAAAGEARLAFLVANPGVADWGKLFLGKMEEFSPLIGKLHRQSPRSLDALLGAAGKLSPFLQWGLADSMWKHGVSSPSALMTDMARYGRQPDFGRITCPALVIDGEAEEYGQARELYDLLGGPKTFLRFTEDEAAALHVQTASLALASQRIFDWIDDTTARR
jgi:alpha-beta hydrolase superfamily lysophospholipase